jgi:hypothetical protein
MMMMMIRNITYHDQPGGVGFSGQLLPSIHCTAMPSPFGESPCLHRSAVSLQQKFSKFLEGSLIYRKVPTVDRKNVAKNGQLIIDRRCTIANYRWNRSFAIYHYYHRYVTWIWPVILGVPSPWPSHPHPPGRSSRAFGFFSAVRIGAGRHFSCDHWIGLRENLNRKPW